MALSMKPEHLRRYKDVARLLFRYGRGDVVRAMQADSGLFDEKLEGVEPEEVDGDPEALAAELEALGPTFIKLGQLLSSRSDLLPVPYLEALSRLQDRVEPFPFEEVEKVVTEELGVRISKAFSEFDAEPLAAASLAQVHRARLRDGREVAVKVQRPNIRETVLEDLEAFGEMAEFLDHHTETGRRLAFSDMMDEFRRSLLRELDYRLEAQNLSHLRRSIRSYRRIVVPEPIEDYSTSRVLTMEYVRGTKVTELPPVARTELDGRVLAEDLARAYLDGILIEGFFHADPHPGNVMVTDDGRLGVVDLGMVGRVDEHMQELLLKLVLAIAEGKGHEAAQLTLQLGKRLDGFDERRFTREVADLVHTFHDSELAELNLGRVILELARRSAETGLRPASELTLLGKTLLHLDEVSRALDPEFDPTSAIRSHADSLMRRHMLKSLSPGNMFSALLDLNEFAQQLPGRLNRLFESLLKNELELNLQVIDESLLMDNLQKIANRIALAMVLAALIVGAALMMGVETSFRLFGYPGIAMLLFLAAAACGFVLVGSILYFDFWKQRGSRGPRRRE
jgi:predicted unusual protein kinase regulating ubiquinone biosynthesis (AarF/ABC1/UbiB family)